jgi:hypothetical protein
MYVYCVCAALYAGTGLATGWSPVQGNWKSGHDPTKLQNHLWLNEWANAAREETEPRNTWHGTDRTIHHRTERPSVTSQLIRELKAISRPAITVCCSALHLLVITSATTSSSVDKTSLLHKYNTRQLTKPGSLSTSGTDRNTCPTHTHWYNAGRGCFTVTTGKESSLTLLSVSKFRFPLWSHSWHSTCSTVFWSLYISTTLHGVICKKTVALSYEMLALTCLAIWTMIDAIE